MTLQLLLQRFVALLLLLTTLTACSSADGKTPSYTQTPIPAMPTSTATFTISLTDTPTATITPTEVPSILDQLGVWNPEKPGGMTPEDFPLFDKAKVPAAIDAVLSKLVVNADGSSTYNGKPLFAGDAPKAFLQAIFIFEGKNTIYNLGLNDDSIKFSDWCTVVFDYQADNAHGADISGVTEYHLGVLVNTTQGVRAYDVILGLTGDRIDRMAITDALQNIDRWESITFQTGRQAIEGIEYDAEWPPAMQIFTLSEDKKSLVPKPGTEEFINAMDLFTLIQINFPSSGFIKINRR